MFTSVAKLFAGGTGTYLIVLLVGIGLGFWWSGPLGDILHAQDYKALASDAVKTAGVQSRTMVSTVQNCGRRQMNDLWLAQAERARCDDLIETFRGWDAMDASARSAARKRADQLQADLAAQAAKYQQLVKSYEDADATTSRWLSTELPRSVSCLRYPDAGCAADGFAAAGYPAPASDPKAVAQPPK